MICCSINYNIPFLTSFLTLFFLTLSVNLFAMAQAPTLPVNLLIKNLTLSIPNTLAEVHRANSPVIEMKSVSMKNGNKVPIKIAVFDETCNQHSGREPTPLKMAFLRNDRKVIDLRVAECRRFVRNQ